MMILPVTANAEFHDLRGFVYHFMCRVLLTRKLNEVSEFNFDGRRQRGNQRNLLGFWVSI